MNSSSPILIEEQGNAGPIEHVKPWHIYLAGDMRVVGPEGPVPMPKSKKARALLAYVCLEYPRRLSRAHLAAQLWDTTGVAAGRRYVRDALYHLEQTTHLREHGIIVVEREIVAFNPDRCVVDVLNEPDWCGPLLDGFPKISEQFDEWLRDEQSRYENRIHEKLSSTVRALIAGGALADDLVNAARKLVTFDPTDEGGVATLMQALADSGQTSQALREYRCCVDELAKIKTPPSPELTRLYNALRTAMAQPATIPVARTSGHADLVTLVPGSQSVRFRGPKVAVLPFHNQSGDKRHNVTAEGLADNLISVLGRVPGFFVTSRLTTRAFRNQDRLPQDLGDMLDVRYIVSGSLQIANSQIWVNVELADTATGAVIWAERIDQRFSDLIAAQIQLGEEIVNLIAPRLRLAEMRRIHAKKPGQLTAYELFLGGQEAMHNSSRAVFDGAEQLFRDAIARDPNYADPLAWLAYLHVLRIGQGWSSDPARDAQLATLYAKRAIDCDPYEPMGFAIEGHIEAYIRRNFSGAADRFEQAIELNPNDVAGHLWKAGASAWAGDGEVAVTAADRALALSPYGPLAYACNAIAGMAHLAAGEYARAVEFSQRALRDNRTYTGGYRQLAIALMLAGHGADAAAAARRAVELEPGLTVEGFRLRYPGRDSAHAAIYCQALTEAGVPRG